MRLDLVVPAWATRDDGRPSHPSPPQREFMTRLGTHDNVFYLGGLGAGKTFSGAWALLTQILRNREVMRRRGRSGELLYAMAAPHYQDLSDGTIPAFVEVCDQWADANGFNWISKITKTKPQHIYLRTGDVIKTVATDAGKWKGASIAGALGDELEESIDPMGALKLIRKRLRSAKAPRRFLIVTSTPGLEGEGILPWWLEQMNAEPKRYALVRARTDTNPAHEGTDYVRDLRAAMSAGEAASRLDGEPQPPENTVFGREFSKAESIARGWQWPGRIPDGREVFLCFDWGSHYAALFILHDPETGLDIVFDELHIDGCQTDAFLDAVLQRCRRHGFAPADVRRVYCDPQPDDDLRMCMSKRYFRGRTRFHPRWDRDTKRESIKVVQWRLNPGEGARRLLLAPAMLRTPYERGLVRCFGNYTWKTARDGGRVTVLDRVRQDHWSSHAVDALRQYCWRYRHERIKQIGSRSRARDVE